MSSTTQKGLSPADIEEIIQAMVGMQEKLDKAEQQAAEYQKVIRERTAAHQEELREKETALTTQYEAQLTAERQARTAENDAHAKERAALETKARKAIDGLAAIDKRLSEICRKPTISMSPCIDYTDISTQSVKAVQYFVNTCEAYMNYIVREIKSYEDAEAKKKERIKELIQIVEETRRNAATYLAEKTDIEKKMSGLKERADALESDYTDFVRRVYTHLLGKEPPKRFKREDLAKKVLSYKGVEVVDAVIDKEAWAATTKDLP